MEKLCIFCKYCGWMDDRGMGSDETGAYGSNGFECIKGHYDNWYGEGKDFDGIVDVRALFLKAETCPDFTPLKEIAPRKSAN